MKVATFLCNVCISRVCKMLLFVCVFSTCIPEGEYCQNIDCRGVYHLYLETALCESVFSTLVLFIVIFMVNRINMSLLMNCCHQWMVGGPRGRCGLTVPSHVGRENRFEPEPVSTHHHATTAHTVQDLRETPRTVTLDLVWVLKCCRRSLTPSLMCVTTVL